MGAMRHRRTSGPGRLSQGPPDQRHLGSGQELTLQCGVDHARRRQRLHVCGISRVQRSLGTVASYFDAAYELSPPQSLSNVADGQGSLLQLIRGFGAFPLVIFLDPFERFSSGLATTSGAPSLAPSINACSTARRRICVLSSRFAASSSPSDNRIRGADRRVPQPRLTASIWCA
jgi:hypothetical protein